MLHLNTTQSRLKDDPAAEALITLLDDNRTSLGIDESTVYYRFPLYRDDDNVVTARVIIVSPRHGVIVFSATEITEQAPLALLREADAELDIVFGQLHARLTKQRSLRQDKKNSSF